MEHLLLDSNRPKNSTDLHYWLYKFNKSKNVNKRKVFKNPWLGPLVRKRRLYGVYDKRVYTLQRPELKRHPQRLIVVAAERLLLLTGVKIKPIRLSRDSLKSYPLLSFLLSLFTAEHLPKTVSYKIDNAQYALFRTKPVIINRDHLNKKPIHKRPVFFYISLHTKKILPFMPTISVYRRWRINKALTISWYKDRTLDNRRTSWHPVEGDRRHFNSKETAYWVKFFRELHLSKINSWRSPKKDILHREADFPLFHLVTERYYIYLKRRALRRLNRIRIENAIVRFSNPTTDLKDFYWGNPSNIVKEGDEGAQTQSKTSDQHKQSKKGSPYKRLRRSIRLYQLTTAYSCPTNKNLKLYWLMLRRFRMGYRANAKHFLNHLSFDREFWGEEKVVNREKRIRLELLKVNKDKKRLGRAPSWSVNLTLSHLKKSPLAYSRASRVAYSHTPNYDIVSGGSAALLAALFGFLITEKAGFELLDSGDFYFAFLYLVIICFCLKPLLCCLDWQYALLSNVSPYHIWFFVRSFWLITEKFIRLTLNNLKDNLKTK